MHNPIVAVLIILIFFLSCIVGMVNLNYFIISKNIDEPYRVVSTRFWWTTTTAMIVVILSMIGTIGVLIL